MFNVQKAKMIVRVCLFAFMLMFVALPVLAATLDTGVDVVGGETGLGNRDIRETTGAIINVALGFLGVITVVIVLIGGFKYMIAGGNEEKVDEAKAWILSGIIGLAIILSAYAITSFVVDKLISATAESGTATAD